MPELRRRTPAQIDTAVKKSLALAFAVFRVFVLVAVVQFLVGWIVDNDAAEDREAQAEAHTAIVDMMSGKSPDEVKTIANTIIELNAQDLTTVITDAGENGMDVLDALHGASATGNVPVQFTDNEPVKSFWMKAYIELVVLLLGLILSVVVTAYYVNFCFQRGHYLADLNWKAPKSYLLLAALLPFGWPFLVVSTIRMSNRPQRTQTQDEPVLTHYYGRDHFYADVEDEENRPRDTGRDLYNDDEAGRAPVQFANAPVAARFRWIEIRTQAHLRSANRREATLVGGIKDSEDSLRYHGQEIQELQRRLAEQRADHAKLVAARESTAETVSAEIVAGEFDRLMQLPGVTAVRVVDGKISLLVEPVIAYDGNNYDIGSWELRIGEDSDAMYSRELRKSVRKSWIRRNGRGVYPDYRYPGNNSFCFGARQYEINDYVVKGQFLEAFDLAINCMHSTNMEDTDDIPNAFRKKSER